MSSGLVLIVIVAAAYLAAHVLFDWIGRRYLIISGAEYLLLGVLLGPYVAGILNPTVTGRFAPLMTLALGWIGALIGAQFHFAKMSKARKVYFRVAFIEGVATLALVSSVAVAAFVYVLGASLRDSLIAGIALGAIGTVSAPSGIALITRDVARRSPLVHQLEIATAIDALIAVVTFGILVSVVHTGPVAISRPPTPTEWAAITLAIGFLGGALFHLFLGDEEDPDRLFIALAGALVVASGAAAYMRLSPLLPTLIIGAVLVNTSQNAVAIRNVLGRVERPLYYVLLLFAGAAWTPHPGIWWLLPVLAFPFVRAASKLIGAYLGARTQGTLPAVGPGWGRALFGHGALALAIAFNYQLLDEPFGAIVFTAAIASLLVTDVISARVVRQVFSSYRERMRHVLLGTPAAPARAAAASPDEHGQGPAGDGADEAGSDTGRGA